MMWSSQYHDRRPDSEVILMGQGQLDVESGNVEQRNTSTFLHPSHDDSVRLPPGAIEVNKPGGALLLSSRIRPLVSATGPEANNNHCIHNRWTSSPTHHDHLLSNKKTSTSSQNSFLLADITSMKSGMSMGSGVSSSLCTSSISNNDDVLGGDGRLQQQQGVPSSLSSEAVRSSLMTIEESHLVESGPAEEKELPYHALHFPWRLHQMLEAAESHGFSHIVSWLPDLQDHNHNRSTTHLQSGITKMTSSSNERDQKSPLSRKKRIAGTPFRVHEPGIFEKVIMPRFFRQTKFKSFRRQINLWSFERIRNGPNKGGYQNDYFVRTNPSLCARMRRSKSKRPRDDHEEDLATHSAASNSIQEQQEGLVSIGNYNSQGVSSCILPSHLHDPTTTISSNGSTEPSSMDHSAVMVSVAEPDPRTTTTNIDRPDFTGNSLSSSSLSWFESHQVSLLNYAYTIIRVSQKNDSSVAPYPNPALSSSHVSSTDDIEQELISTFCPSFNRLLDNDDSK